MPLKWYVNMTEAPLLIHRGSFVSNVWVLINNNVYYDPFASSLNEGSIF